MSSVTLPFAPILPTVTLAASEVSDTVALGTKGGDDLSTPTGSGSPTFPGGFSVRVVNAGPDTAFIKFGNSASAAAAETTTSMPMAAETKRIFSVSDNVTHMGAICAAGETATVYATSGEGGV